MSFYNISQIPDRIQTAQHFHSSLEQPNLENVEAQLYAARQKNYLLAKQYFEHKYGNGELYNQYIQNNNLSGLGAPQEPTYDFKRALDQKALQIQQQQMRKIGNISKRQGEGDYESRQYGKKKQRQNIWDRPQIKVEEEEKEEKVQDRPCQINMAEQGQRAFMSGFKSYLSNKKKLKQEQTQSKMQLNQSSTSQFKESTWSQSPRKKGQKQRCYEQELVKKVFRDVNGKVDKHSQMERVSFIEYLNSNYKILKMLGITAEEVSTTVMALNCKDSNLMTVGEGLIWVYNCIGKVDEAKRLKAQQQFEEVPDGCMLSKELMQLFQDTFRAMDRHNDLIIKRVPFIGRLTSEPLVKKNLNLPAVFEPEYSRHISLRRVFERIQIETLLCSQEQQKLNQYISWNQFTKYFQSGHKQRGSYDLIVLVQSLKNQQKFGFSHLPEVVSQIIGHSFRKLDKGEEMFNTIQLINQIRMHKEFQVQKYTFIKQGGQDGEGTSETFEDILVRIKERGLKYVSPKEFLQYFSDRGKPIEEFQQERKMKQSKNFSPTKVSFIEQEMFPKGEDAPDGYDSDPEMYNNSQLNQLPQEGRKSQKQFKRFKQTSQSFLQPDSNIQYEEDIVKNIIKVTVPQPFSFEEREKERKLARSQQQSLQTIAQQHHFKAQKVPSKVKQVGLYEKMITEQQKKNEDRKRSSMIMTLANERPFSFESRKANKKTQKQREEFVFKAEPIPWFCSIDLLARKGEEEILRKERIAKTAQQKLTKSKLPPRMEKDLLQKQAKKAQSPVARGHKTQSVIKVRDPPDFEKIHKNFEEALERKRKQNKTTEVKQFRFLSTVKDTSSKMKAEEPALDQSKKVKHDISSLKSNVDIFAQSTVKFTQQVEMRRQEVEQKRRKEERRKQDEEERQKIDQQLKRKVQEAARRNKENKEKDISQKNKEANAQQLAEYKVRKNEIIDKARKQPMLMDRVSKRDEKIEKMKKLHQISQTLLKNGIRGKDHDHYFKREELLLLEDYKQLKDKL